MNATVVRLMHLTPWLRYLILAAACHTALLVVIGTIKLVVPPAAMRAIFDPSPLPPLKDDPNIFDRIRDTVYNPAGFNGGGGGAPVTLPEQIPVTLLTTDARTTSKLPSEVIGPVSESVTDIVRLQGVPGGLGAPIVGLANKPFGIPGGKGNAFVDRLDRVPKAPTPTTRSVIAALRWLKENQQSDGSWQSPRPVAVSALATLALLGHGETPDNAEFGPTLGRAFDYLAGRVKTDANLYDHAILTYALAEGYGMTKSPTLREPLQRAVDILLQAQQVAKKDPRHTGGWRYTAGATDADVSVTGWCVQALEAAKLAGIAVPDAALESASAFLWNMYAAGSFGYDKPADSHRPTTTAIGVLCQAFLGHGGDPRSKASLDKLKTTRFDWDKNSGQWTVYMWYYLTQAMFHGGGSYWQHWDGCFRDALIRHQADDGHWEYPPQTKENYGHAYSTALCCLMLEVYYRYLPTYQRIEEKLVGTSPGAYTVHR